MGARQVLVSKPMGAVLEELPGRVFVAELAAQGGAAALGGQILAGDKVEAVEGEDCAALGLDEAPPRLAAHRTAPRPSLATGPSRARGPVP